MSVILSDVVLQGYVGLLWFLVTPVAPQRRICRIWPGVRAEETELTFHASGGGEEGDQGSVPFQKMEKGGVNHPVLMVMC